MVVCQFFLRGNCKFGDTCRNEHPGVKQGGFGNNGWVNRASGSSSNSNSNSTPKGNLLPYNAANIACDISPTQDKPLWPLSAYGPAKYEPNLIGGLDESAEELRVKAMTAIRAGNVNEYLQYETTKIAAADSVFANARANSTQAFEQAAKQSNFPALVAAASASKSNTGGGSGSAFPSNSSAFGSTSTFGNTTTPSAFGNTATTPSAFGNTATPSAFGQPSFGKSAFGQSAFGQPSFGQPAAPNPLASPSSAFGQTSTPGTTSAFGQTSPTTTTGFGQTSNSTTSAFSQPQTTTSPVSAFGQPQQPTSAFGQPAQPPAATSAFGQPSFGQATLSPTSSSIIKPASGAFSAFANNGTPSPFGSTANTAGSTAGGAFSAFAGQPSAFGLGAAAGTNPQQQAGGSVFGQPGFGQPAPATANNNTTASAFGNLGQNNTGTTSVFGTPSFGQQTAAPVSAFRSGPAATAGPAFGQTGFGNAATTSPFGAGPQAPSAYGNTSTPGALAPPTTNPQHLSVFPTAPSISMTMNSPSTSVSTPRSGPASASTLDVPDFAGLIKKGGLYNPNATPYDSQLPSNYIELLPKEIVDAFNGDKFTWGSVPDWVPPVEVR